MATRKTITVKFKRKPPPLPGHCACPSPELCRALNRHIGNYLFDIWAGTVLTPEACETWRQTWAKNAGVDIESIRHLRATNPIQPRRQAGVGTELKKLLASIGIHPTPGCKCNTRANEMNQNGIAWCRENIDTIVGWLQEEAERIGAPFVRVAVVGIVRLAIRQAERKAAKHQ